MSKQHCAMNLDTTKQTLIHNINRPKSSKLFPMLNDAKGKPSINCSIHVLDEDFCHGC